MFNVTKSILFMHGNKIHIHIYKYMFIYIYIYSIGNTRGNFKMTLTIAIITHGNETDGVVRL